jgi:hypothetical protein
MGRGISAAAAAPGMDVFVLRGRVRHGRMRTDPRGIPTSRSRQGFTQAITGASAQVRTRCSCERVLVQVRECARGARASDCWCKCASAHGVLVRAIAGSSARVRTGCSCERLLVRVRECALGARASDSWCKCASAHWVLVRAIAGARARVRTGCSCER